MASRSVPFQVNKGEGAYPSEQYLVFGSDAAHSDFVTTMARFEFHKSDGSAQITGSPAIFIRMGGPFQTGLASSYSESSNMFGTPNTTGNDINKDSMLKLLKGGADAIYKQIANAGAGAAGFIGSAGLSGKAQYEFATRTALNTFKQLTYGGPTFRKFSLPFTMRPTSKKEAEDMIKIIKTFRVAAAAKGAGSVGLNEKTGTLAKLDDLEGDALAAAEKANATATALLSAADIEAIGLTNSAAGVTGAIIASPNVISFGYPDMCLFQILIKKGNSNADSLSSVFESALCVIENVAIDYGSQNKMVFFDPGTTTGTGTNARAIYYPAEVTLTISLTETTLTTAGSVTEDHNQPTLTIF